MAKYEVCVKEVSYGFVTIEAENEDEIYEKAQDVYFEGNVNWGKCDFDITSYEKIED